MTNEFWDAATQKYVQSRGRASLRQYWMFVLGYFLIYVGAVVLETMMGLRSLETGLGPITGLYQLLIIPPWIALTTRRLHDSDHSGWWQLVGLVPIIGWLIMLWFLLAPTGTEPNRYGSPIAAAPVADSDDEEWEVATVASGGSE